MNATLYNFIAQKISRQSINREVAFLEEMNTYYLQIIFQAQIAHMENNLRLEELRKNGN